jgi:hypothetical protein
LPPHLFVLPQQSALLAMFDLRWMSRMPTFRCPNIDCRELWSSQMISNHLLQPFLIVVTSSRPRTPSTSPNHCNPQPPLCPSFPSTILEQCREWIQISMPFHSRPPERFHYTFKGFHSLRTFGNSGLAM